MPADVGFATKPDIALQQVRQTMEADIKTGIVFADADYCAGVHEDLMLPLYHYAGRALGVPRSAESRRRNGIPLRQTL